MIRKQKGFTLIELLVVIAIIGILSSVVLASLNSARGKGSDAAAKSGLSNLQAQAAIYYDSAGAQSYDTASSTTCTSSTGLFTDTQTKTIISNVTSNAQSITCNSSKTTYAVSVVLKGAGTSWCVDSNGNATTTNVNTGDGLCI